MKGLWVLGRGGGGEGEEQEERKPERNIPDRDFVRKNKDGRLENVECQEQ